MNAFRAEFDTHSPAETIAAGQALGVSMHPGLCLILQGDLGAGKTTLVKGIAMALEAADPEEVTSPTFTLLHEYRGTLPSPRPDVSDRIDVVLYHLDLYRLDDEHQLAALGLDEIRNDSAAILLIEWGEKFPGLVAFTHGSVSLEHRGADDRHIVAHWHNPPVDYGISAV